MTARAETLDLKPGQCRVCGCTERKPCAIEFIDDDGETAAVSCTWVDPARTLCSNPNCLEMARGERRDRAAASAAGGFISAE
jgi:hypothetical protein